MFSGGHRLLVEEQAEALDGADDLDRRLGVPAAVHVDGDVVVRPARLADRLDQCHRLAQLRLGHLAVHRPARERVELAAGVALRDQLLRPRRIGRRALLDAFRPAVGVDAQALLHLAAEELVDRHAELLADEIVERDVDGADGGEHHPAHAVVVEEPVHPLPQLLDVPGALADDDRAQVADGGGDRLDAGEVGAFTPADQAVGGLDAAEQPRPIAADTGQEHGLAFGDGQALGSRRAHSGVRGGALRLQGPGAGGEQAAAEAEGRVAQERAAAGAAGDGGHEWTRNLRNGSAAARACGRAAW